MIGVIGAGAFGTALAVVQAAEGRRVALWGRDRAAMAAAEARAKLAAAARAWRCRPGWRCVAELAALDGAEALLLALPAQATEAFLAAHGPALPAAPLVLCAKGIDAARLPAADRDRRGARARPAAGGADRTGLRRRDRPRPADRADARLRRSRARAGAAGAAQRPGGCGSI